MKRSKGEGSVYKRKDGSWCAQHHDGNKRRYIYGKKKLKEGLSPRSVEYIHITINRAISQAVLWQKVQSNVASVVKPPKPLKKEIEVLMPRRPRGF